MRRGSLLGVVTEADAASSVAADLMLDTVGPLADGVNALADENKSAVAIAVNFMFDQFAFNDRMVPLI